MASLRFGVSVKFGGARAIRMEEKIKEEEEERREALRSLRFASPTKASLDASTVVVGVDKSVLVTVCYRRSCFVPPVAFLVS